MASLKGPLLILEDDADEREILQEVFNRMKLVNKIIFFKTGKELVEFLKTTSLQPFLIISDVNVPQLTGLEAKRIINDDDFLRRRSIPFVFLSTTAERQSVEEAYNLNTQGYFVKQNTVDEIERQLRIIMMYWSECRHTNSD